MKKERKKSKRRESSIYGKSFFTWDPHPIHDSSLLSSPFLLSLFLVAGRPPVADGHRCSASRGAHGKKWKRTAAGKLQEVSHSSVPRFSLISHTSDAGRIHFSPPNENHLDSLLRISSKALTFTRAASSQSECLQFPDAIRDRYYSRSTHSGRYSACACRSSVILSSRR